MSPGASSIYWKVVKPKRGKKNQAAVALASLRMSAMTAEERRSVAKKGGLVGGKARAAKLIAKKAAVARWAKRKPKA